MELNNGGDHAHDSYFVKAAGGINDQPVSQAPQAEQILEPVITNGHERPSDSPSKGADDEKQASGEARPASQAPGLLAIILSGWFSAIGIIYGHVTL